MATKRKGTNRRSNTFSRKANFGRRSNAAAAENMAFQGAIKTDYKALAIHYGVLFRKLWEIPTTKYILSGVAVVGLLPMTVRFFRSHPEIKDFVRENLESVEEKFEEVGDKITHKVSELKGGRRDDLRDLSH